MIVSKIHDSVQEWKYGPVRVPNVDEPSIYRLSTY